MPEAPKMPSIPTPLKGNPDSVHDTLTALKLATEHFMGTRGNQPVTRTFIQEGMPTAYVNGDTWVRPSTGKISYWNGSAWIQTV